MFSNEIIKKRILLFGANGMLGQRLVEFYSKQQSIQLLSCSAENEPVFEGQDYKQIDITKREVVKDLVYDFYPDVIINAAAFTNVDLSETEREQAWKTNVKAVEYIAEVSRVIDSHIIHISTDYIFNGKKGPYSEKDKPGPLGYYARTKLASENVLRISGTYYTILRTNVLYGIAHNSRPDFVRWVVNSVRSGKRIKIVTDQVNNPTFIDDLIQAISKVIEYKKYGIYNIGGKEFLSRFDFTMKIADFFDLDKSLIAPITTPELNQPAPRPLKSGLIILKAQTEIGYKPHSIDESLAKMKKELSL
ncbi:MAG TPA: dTDP-4-dehydrorhamnose reductase [Ignavibacteriaceae bacterium]|jgi:dTDP-4-dehydrorhamnose reductase|nr:dTDP-4-dehydrorhamnose reductase [Ignavibacteriaceae bacterium]